MSARPSGRHRERYSAVAVVIHWWSALFILANLVLGHLMEWLPVSARPVLMPLHAWIGVSVLLLTLSRIGARFAKPPPPDAFAYRQWERWLARAVQLCLYLSMLVLPILGYCILSANPPNPLRQLSFWGIGHIPWLDMLSSMERTRQKTLHDELIDWHAFGAWLLVGLLALHIAGVLKHRFLDGRGILYRMLLKPRSLDPQ